MGKCVHNGRVFGTFQTSTMERFCKIELTFSAGKLHRICLTGSLMLFRQFTTSIASLSICQLGAFFYHLVTQIRQVYCFSVWGNEFWKSIFINSITDIIDWKKKRKIAVKMFCNFRKNVALMFRRNLIFNWDVYVSLILSCATFNSKFYYVYLVIY